MQTRRPLLIVASSLPGGVAAVPAKVCVQVCAQTPDLCRDRVATFDQEGHQGVTLQPTECAGTFSASGRGR